MKFSKRSKILLLGLLVLLNIVIRIQSVPHPIGYDSFVIHILANSLSEFGYAKWWIHPLSIVGDYPYSYASALPFFISGISQCIGLEVEHMIWLYCIFIAIFSIFAAYIMAGVIIDDDLFKFSVAFGFSLAPAVLAYSSWTTQSRGFFVLLIPLFIYLLLKCHNSIPRYSLLIFILILLLFSTHHYVYFLIPILVSYFIVSIYFKLRKHIKSVKIPEKLTPFIPIMGFLLMYSIPFFTRHFVVEPYSRYIDWESYVRYIGILIIPAAGGLTYLIFKRDKKHGEWFILLFAILFTPFICNSLYMRFFFPIFAILLAGIGLKNALEVSGQKKKYAVVAVIILLLLFVSFSGVYQHWRTNITGRTVIHKWYMEETPYTGALWIKDNIDINKRLICNDYLTSRRMFAISEVPTFIWDADACLLTYGFANESDITLFKNSPSTEEYYMDAPYIDVTNPKIRWYGYNIWERGEKFGNNVINRFNLSYAIKDNVIGEKLFARVLKEKKDKLYDNGRIHVWQLD